MHALEAKPKQKKKPKETRNRRKKRKPRVPVVFGPGGNNIGVFFWFLDIGVILFQGLRGM